MVHYGTNLIKIDLTVTFGKIISIVFVCMNFQILIVYLTPIYFA